LLKLATNHDSQRFQSGHPAAIMTLLVSKYLFASFYELISSAENVYVTKSMAVEVVVGV
jgi:hypothetical protein